ncbi:lipopolysaccharide biosynthesis protein [Chromobacterium amazonense]|uniref:lipopolysaccharide biosynthesis protein n=1 Tax=Chromobacterium amazonense TaxID=1382803 RepID=UPI0011B20B8A|nr:hypothetical protein [Chromobacterium amazonense]
MKSNHLSMLWISLSRLAQALIGLLSLKVITHWLPVEQFAKLGLITAFTGFFGLFLINPVGQYINRHTHEWYHTGNLISQLRKFNLYITILAFLGFLTGIIWGYTTSATSSSYSYIFMLGLGIGASIWIGTWNNTLIPLLNMLGLRIKSINLAFLTVALGLAISILFVGIKQDALFWLYGQLLGLSICSIIAHRVLLKICDTSHALTSRFIEPNVIKAYCIPIAITAGLLWSLTSGYRFIVDSVWGSYNLGLLILGLGVASQFWSVVEAIVSQIILPKYYQQLSYGNRNYSIAAFNNMINTVFPIYVLMLGLGVSSCISLISILVDPKYHSSIVFCQIAMFAEFFRASSSMLNQSAQIDKKMAAMLTPYLIATIFAAIGLIMLLKSKLDFIYVPLILMTALGITSVISLISASRRVTVKINITLLCSASLLSLLPISASRLLKASSLLGNMSILTLMAVISLLSMAIILRYNRSFREIISTKLPHENH